MKKDSYVIIWLTVKDESGLTELKAVHHKYESWARKRADELYGDWTEEFIQTESEWLGEMTSRK